jgi:hypothetical protein
MIGARRLPFRALPKDRIGSVDPDAFKIPARRAECSLTENARSPFHAEPGQIFMLEKCSHETWCGAQCPHETPSEPTQCPIECVGTPGRRISDRAIWLTATSNPAKQTCTSSNFPEY